MKTATFPPLRVEPKLRKDVERLLAPGESLSTFIEQAVREVVERRTADAEFGARALDSREASKNSGRYHSAASVLRELKSKTASLRRRSKRR